MSRDLPGVRVNAGLLIPRDELEIKGTLHGGPGGQRADRKETRVVVTFSVAKSPSLGPRQRAWLLERLASRLTDRGELVVSAGSTRVRTRNEEEALERMAELLRGGLERPKARRKTKPTRGSKRRRLDTKKKHSKTKQLRKKPRNDGH